MENPTSPPVWWHAPALILGFIGLYLLWAMGFDWLCREMSGGWIESALNWLSRVWLWAGLVLFAVAIAVSMLTKR
jgi:hypothetical protein